MTTEAPETRRRRKEERPDEILAAALTVFTREGFAAARLDEIAERAGCTKGTIYVYFASKEELFKAVVHKLVTPKFRAVDEVLKDASLDVPTRIRHFVKGAYKHVAENPEAVNLLRLMIADGPKFSELVDFYLEEIPRRGLALLSATLKEGIARGELRNIDLDYAPFAIIGPINAENIRRLMMGHRDLDMDRMVDAHLDMLFNGILAKPSRSAK
jgi:AcrR family transcriptional regulator